MNTDRIDLSPEVVEAIARRVVELLEEQQLQPYCSLVDANELASLLGVKRSWVYEHAASLGAVKLGDGSGPVCASTPRP